MKLKTQSSKFKSTSQISKVLRFLTIVLTFNICVLSLPLPVFAQVKIGDVFGFGDIQSVGQLTSNLVTPVFSIAAVLVIGYFLYGAFNYLKSEGNKESLAAARQMIKHAIIGFIILILCFFVLQFLLSTLFGASKFNTIF